MAVSVKSLNGDIIIAAAYFNGQNINRATLLQFKADIRLITSLRKSFFICGDFNAKHRHWNNIRANQKGNALYTEMLNRQFIIENSPNPTYYPPQARAVHPSTYCPDQQAS